MLKWILKTLSKGVALLPSRWATALGRHWGWMLAHVIRLRRTYVLAALARCFPEKTERERRTIYEEMCCQQALNLTELLRLEAGKNEELGSLMDVNHLERVDAARAQGKGVLLLVAHFGNYPLLVLQTPKRLGFPLSIVYKPLGNRTMDGLWREMREKAGVNGILARRAYRASVQALRNNDLVGVMLDQNRPVEHGIFVDFFGEPASTTPGLAIMSAQTGAPVLPVFMHRTPEGRHVVEVRALIDPPPDRKEETILAYTAKYTQIIEDEIRRHPEQWLWMHKRWKSRPRDGNS